MLRYLSVITLMIILFLSAQSEATAKQMVLYLSSYHNGYAWSDNILRGITTALTESGKQIELQIEYLDSKKFDYDLVAPEVARLYKRKFTAERFDVIIVSDDNALNFMLEYGDDLFPGVPIVFCGINSFTPERIKGRDITGVLENIDPKTLFDIALTLHPELKRVVVIGDESTTGRAIRSQIKRVVPDFEGRLTFVFWNKIGLPGLLDSVRNLPADTMLYFIPVFLNSNGMFYSTEELAGMVAKASRAPVFSNWAFLLGQGEVGGPLLSGIRHGSDVAQLALRVLAGEKAGDISVQRDIQSELVFDYTVLMAQHINLKLIPPGSRFINAPSPFYELNKQIFWIIMAFLAILITVVILLVRSIARRKVAEKEIVEQLSFLELLLDTIPLHICWKDLDQRYLGVNRSFMKFYCMDSSERLIHRTDQEVHMNSEFRSQMTELDKKVINSGQPVLKHQAPNVNDSGEQVMLEVTKVPLRDMKGEIVGTLSIVDDITREVYLERRLMQSQRMEAIGALAGGVAHDFNNILTAILNSAELTMSVLPQGFSCNDLERVIRAAKRGSGVVKQILAFSRPTQEGFTNVSISDSINEAVNLVERSLPRNITLELDLVAPGRNIWADPNQIVQVVMNLCTNSYQAMRETGGCISIVLRPVVVDSEMALLLSLPLGHYLSLAVTDNGPGIPTDIIDNVFDPFFTTKGPGEGTGLGLAMVHGIVKSHGGAVRLRSIPQVETCIEIFLPIREIEGDQAPSKPMLPMKGAERLLFVEDDEDQLATTPRILESLGYQVTACANAEDALASLRRTPGEYQLLITDFDMPAVNGLELAEAATRLCPKLPVLLITGRERAVTTAQSSQSITGVLLKPFSKATISEAIRKTLK